VALLPQRLALAASLPDIQHDISSFVAPPATFNDGSGNVVFQLGPVFTLFSPARLSHTPTKADQQVLANALNTIEAVYPFSPAAVNCLSLHW
jgi:hypothetical protein